MAHIGAFLFTLLGFFLACAKALPQSTSDPNFVDEVINALQAGLVTDINVFLTFESLITNITSVNFDVRNPLSIELTIDRVVSSAGVNGTVFVTFDQTFAQPVVVPPGGTNNSGTFGNVLLVQGAIATLDIIPLGALDLVSIDVFVRAATTDGMLGIPIAIKGLKQTAVFTTYSLILS